MTLEEILDKAVRYSQSGLPFAIYAKPGWKKVCALFQGENLQNSVNNHADAGFIFTTCNAAQKIMIPFKESEVYAADIAFNLPIQPLAAASNLENKFFIALIEKALESISKGEMQKVVLSRCEEVSLNDNSAEVIYTRLLNEYENAFRYWFYHPEAGSWMGATPEKLFSVKENSFEVMSLAGTRVAGTDHIWGEKEQVEQQWVTDYIVSCINLYTKDYKVSVPYTHKAGALEHLRTDIYGFIQKKNIIDLIASLHPTPAVCGFPKEKAKKFLADHEGYDRSFYTGFLGLINDPSPEEPQTDLYVNLRCMKIINNKAHLYVGCGITAGSDPTAEYNETINKSITIKKVLQ